MRKLTFTRSFFLASYLAFRTFFCGGVSGLTSSRCGNLRARRAASVAGLRSASVPDGRLHLDAGLLGVGSCGLLLGAGRMGDATDGRRAVDAGLLGLVGRCVRLSRRILGPSHRLLWRRELRLRLHGWDEGGYWRNGAFAYNRCVNINTTVIHKPTSTSRPWRPPLRDNGGIGGRCRIGACGLQRRHCIS